MAGILTDGAARQIRKEDRKISGTQIFLRLTQNTE
jgi:hypothetical protein